MKICKFLYDNKITFGKISDEMIDILPANEMFKENFDTSQFKQINLKDVQKFLPPVAPSKIVCVGRNYAEHAAELGNEVPTEPLLFLKAPSALITEGNSILIPINSNQVEHEGELGVIIGRECSKLKDQDDPLDYIFGFVCLNDVTARDLQKKDVQFTRAKSFDTFCPISYFIETELDSTDIFVKTLVNGETRQSGRTSQMVFPIPFLIRYISNQMTLIPGDIIATGTPSGVSKLNRGDVVKVVIEGLGTLTNVVADSDTN